MLMWVLFSGLLSGMLLGLMWVLLSELLWVLVSVWDLGLAG